MVNPFHPSRSQLSYGSAEASRAHCYARLDALVATSGWAWDRGTGDR